jgi:hypothetical protein
VNRPLLNTLHLDEVDVMIQRVEEAEVDEMWSYVGKKREPRWLWHAIDHRSGHVLAYVLVRSPIASRSQVATLPRMLSTNRPDAVLVSNCSATDSKAHLPLTNSSSTRAPRSRMLRVKRSKLGD